MCLVCENQFQNWEIIKTYLTGEIYKFRLFLAFVVLKMLGVEFGISFQHQFFWHILKCIKSINVYIDLIIHVFDFRKLSHNSCSL